MLYTWDPANQSAADARRLPSCTGHFSSLPSSLTRQVFPSRTQLPCPASSSALPPGLTLFPGVSADGQTKQLTPPQQRRSPPALRTAAANNSKLHASKHAHRLRLGDDHDQRARSSPRSSPFCRVLTPQDHVECAAVDAMALPRPHPPHQPRERVPSPAADSGPRGNLWETPRQLVSETRGRSLLMDPAGTILARAPRPRATGLADQWEPIVSGAGVRGLARSKRDSWPTAHRAAGPVSYPTPTTTRTSRLRAGAYGVLRAAAEVLLNEALPRPVPREGRPRHPASEEAAPPCWSRVAKPSRGADDAGRRLWVEQKKDGPGSRRLAQPDADGHAHGVRLDKSATVAAAVVKTSGPNSR